MKEQTFPAVTLEEWKQAARSSLKGKSLSELYTETAENIKLKPLYTKADVKGGQSSLPGEKPFTRGFDRLGTFPKQAIELAIDPVSEGAAAGVFPSKEVLEHIHNQSFITVNIVPYHMAGANAVQELAVALSEAVFYMKMASNKNEMVSKMIVHFAVGPRFFTEIAKIRAFRTLWSAVMDVYELDERSKPAISVETSEQTLSALDPHVNILRTGSAAFSAVLGNIDYLHVLPFNQVTRSVTELSERIARNIPLILKHEAHLDKVIDPAGGSYYIESLTNEIGRMAWDEFAGIEEVGGIEHVLKAGTIQKEIAAVQVKREKKIGTRKQLLIGTNIYANMTEEHKYVQQKTKRSNMEGEKIVMLTPKRLAEPFEQLRQKVAAIEQTDKSVKAGIICLGKLKTNKPRTDYVMGILAVGGIQTVLSENIETVKEAVRFVETNDFPYYCICGSDSTYEQFGSELVEELRKVSGEAVINVAGKWQVPGLDGFIAPGENIVDKLWALLSLFEGGTER
ncbi:methylmalonyl-CoA mutase family protein [Domibacillus mangrovi]|uniref:Methylmalonyl-CoA mutase alpha/beta chain catalytic domain-containing protein n=1 Tax=Domibacillus mangrovi TaxID=1714354 RepID=A0A1Q5P7A3_9BACI|nr:methylmalonyl-CoA mutase family protein [Domibacillus mangrovi]OKL38058.1 hypothetical protein BLL40_01130 [Domibacillus mangrovi]